jgi:hypothetical protein
VNPNCVLSETEAVVDAASHQLPPELTGALLHLRRLGSPQLAGVLLDGFTKDPVRMARALLRMGILRRTDDVTPHH